MICSNCGSQIDAYSRFCQKCGANQMHDAASEQDTFSAAPYPPSASGSPYHSSVPGGGGYGYAAKKRRPILKVVACVLALAIICGAGWWIFLADNGKNNPFAEKKDEMQALQVQWEEMLAHLDDEDDDDGDGLNNYFEAHYGTDKDNPDTDGDGLTDYIEIIVLKTDPLKADTDGNGIGDGDEDADGDGLTNAYELDHGLNPTLADSDFDGLSDYDEIYIYHTNPTEYDTDGDGASDGWEIAHNFDPLVADAAFDATEYATNAAQTIMASAQVSLTPEQAGTLHVTEITSHYFLNGDMPGYLAPAFDFSVYGEIDSAVITFELDDSLLDAENCQPAIYWFNPDTQTLEEQPTTLEGNIVKAVVSHFSVFTLLDKLYIEKEKELYAQYEGRITEDTDGDGFLDKDETGIDRFIWNISDRDLCLCAAISYTDYNSLSDLSQLSNSVLKAMDKNICSECYSKSNSKSSSGKSPSTCYSIPVSAKELSGWTIESRYTNGVDDFSATVFKKDDNIILAFRGTDDVGDWIADGASVILGLSHQDELAKQTIEKVRNTYKGKNIYITGHSLGGRLAYIAAAHEYYWTDPDTWFNWNEPSYIVKTVTFNALGLGSGIVGVISNKDIDALNKHSGDVYSWGIKDDKVFDLSIWSSGKAGTVHPGSYHFAVQNCYEKDCNGLLGPKHCLGNFIDDLTPATRKQYSVSASPPSGVPPTITGAGAAGAVGTGGTAGAAGAGGSAGAGGASGAAGAGGTGSAGGANGAAGTAGTAGATVATGDAASVTPGSRGAPGTAGIPGTAGTSGASGAAGTSGVLDASDASSTSGILDAPDAYVASGANPSLSGQSGNQQPQDFIGNFAIEGKWKQTGDKTFGQAQAGAIIVFDGIHCNFYSPQDTYAFYVVNNNYQLDITSLLFAENLSFPVSITDYDHITIYGVALFRVQ